MEAKKNEKRRMVARLATAVALAIACIALVRYEMVGHGAEGNWERAESGAPRE